MIQYTSKTMKLDISMLPSMYNIYVGKASFAHCMQFEILKASSLFLSIVELGSWSIRRSSVINKTRSIYYFSVLSSSGPSPLLGPMSTRKQSQRHVYYLSLSYCRAQDQVHS